VLAAALFGARMLGYVPYPVMSDSMSPEIERGSLVYVEEVDPSGVGEGTVVVYDAPAGDKSVVSRVVSNDEDAKLLIVKNDSQSASSGTRIPYSRLVGEVARSLPYLGYLYDYVFAPPGMYVGIAAGGAVVVLFFVAPVVAGILSKRKRAKRTQMEVAQDSAANHEHPAKPAQVQPGVQTRAGSHPTQRSALKREAIPSPMVAPAYPVPYPIVVNQPQLTPFATTVMVPAVGSYQAGEPRRSSQVVLRIEQDLSGASSAYAEGRGFNDFGTLQAFGANGPKWRFVEGPIVVEAETSLTETPEPSEGAHAVGSIDESLDTPVQETGYQADATLSVEEELNRAEEELRAAEKELDAMQVDAQQTEADFLRVQAEIKLAEAELLRAKAELIEKKRAAARMVDHTSSHLSRSSEQSSEGTLVD